MITFPRDDLLSLGGVRDLTFWPMVRQELSRTAGGSTQARDMGSPLWRASFTTAPARIRDAAALEAALISLNGSQNSFTAYDMRRPFPRRHAAGDFDDSAVISERDPSNAFRLRLGRLASGFELSAGDYLGFTYGARSTRALHVITGGGAAGVSGTVWLDVYPAIRTGADLGSPVTLKRASCEMILEAEISGPVLVDLAASSVTFSAIQVF